jgi:hypothetical protein
LLNENSRSKKYFHKYGILSRGLKQPRALALGLSGPEFKGFQEFRKSRKLRCGGYKRPRSG